MAIVAMKKVQVLTLQSSQQIVLDFLQKKASFELIETDIQEQGYLDCIVKLRETEKTVADLDFAIKFLTPHSKSSKGFKYALMGEKEIFSSKRIEEIKDQFNFQEVVLRIQDLEILQNKLKKSETEINKELESVEVLKNMNIDLNELEEQDSVDICFGKVRNQFYPILKDQISKTCKEAELFLIEESPAETAFYVVSSKDLSASIKEIMQKNSAREIKINDKCNNISNYVRSLKEEIRNIKKDLNEISQKTKILVSELPKLKVCYDYFSWEKERREISSRGSWTDYTVIFTGWIKAKKIKKTQLEIEQITQFESAIFEIEPEEGEEPPVEIQNNKFFTPFEAVTRLYGLPKASELDPTPYLSFFFLVFFGFCLTDAIYGLLLAIISFGILKIMKVPSDMKGIFILLGWSGIITVFMGILFAGYAGISESVIPVYLLKLKVFDMNTGTNAVMALAFGLGILQLWVGTLIAGMHEWRTGSKLKAFFTKYSWTILFLAIGISFVLNNPETAKYVRYGGVAFILFGLAWGEPWFLIPIKGPLNFINEIIGWVSNTLSYARLFALGLSTGVVAVVFNQIALTVGEMLPVGVNYIIMIVIILFGHILNIAMNVMGAFIHSARLQFVEFFGKFMEGGGRKFNPLSRKSTYVYIENDNQSI